jgi:uncharacterized repeat protein (TIGR03843 family)
MTSASGLTELELITALTTGDMTIEGRLVAASNQTLRASVLSEQGVSIGCVYKPVQGERPLWDFPDGTLAGRELASFALSRLMGWQVIPTTVWREDGPAGPGMCQVWIDEDPDANVVELTSLDEEHPGWLSILEGEDGNGRQVRLIHADLRSVQEVALLDAIMNNADRKGGHLIVDTSGGLWAIDHGVTFHTEDKLRSVLWGWAGMPIPAELLTPIEGLSAALEGEVADTVTQWLTKHEQRALRRRVDALLTDRVFPLPPQDWPAIPWPVF